jgi:hypothetical protein
MQKGRLQAALPVLAKTEKAEHRQNDDDNKDDPENRHWVGPPFEGRLIPVNDAR